MNSSLPTVAQVLRDSAGYIAAHGFYRPTHARDNYGWSNSRVRPAASDVGAIAFVIYGKPVQMPEPVHCPEFVLFRQAVNAYVDCCELTYTGLSDPDSAEQLVEAFNLAASLWESLNLGGSK